MNFKKNFYDIWSKISTALSPINSTVCIIEGIPTIMHWTTWIFLFCVLFFSTDQFVLFFIIFASIIPHEYAHALAAKKYKIDTEKIWIFPFGGIALLKSMPKDPMKEFVISAAGPLASLIIVLLALPGALLKHNFCFILGIVNLTILLFNLIPAFPMDGGRMLRAGLSFLLGRRKGTICAVRIGQVICVGLSILGIFMHSFTMFLTPIFIGWAAQQEYYSMKYDSVKKII